MNADMELYTVKKRTHAAKKQDKDKKADQDFCGRSQVEI